MYFLCFGCGNDDDYYYYFYFFVAPLLLLNPNKRVKIAAV